MKVSDFLKKEAIAVPLKSRTKNDVFHELINLLHSRGVLADKELALKAVYDREEIMSTGIGHGIAIPHGKAKSVKEIAAASGIYAPGIDYSALDGQPVYLVVMLVGPEDGAAQHVKALARISRLLQHESARQKLIACKNADEFYQIILEEELRTGK